MIDIKSLRPSRTNPAQRQYPAKSPQKVSEQTVALMSCAIIFKAPQPPQERRYSVGTFLRFFILYVIHAIPVIWRILVPVVNLFFQRPYLARRALARCA